RQLHGGDVESFEIDDVGAGLDVEVADVAATEDQHGKTGRDGRVEVLGIGDDLFDTTQSHGLGDVRSWRDEDGDAAEAGDRRDRRHRAGAHIHEDADVHRGTDAVVDESEDDVVDPLVHGLEGVDPVLEDEALPLRRLAADLGEQATDGDTGSRLD